VLIKRTDQQVIAVAWMIAAIPSLNNFSLYTLGYEHGLYRSLFYLPLVLGTFWFALKGAIIISISTVFLYLPCGIQVWDGSSMDDSCLIGEVMVYFFITFVLGLPIVKKIVEAHDGDLRFYTNKERGVTFCVQLPIASAKASETFT